MEEGGGKGGKLTSRQKSMKCSFKFFAGKRKGKSRLKNHFKFMRFDYPHNVATYQADITVKDKDIIYVNVVCRYLQCSALLSPALRIFPSMFWLSTQKSMQQRRSRCDVRYQCGAGGRNSPRSIPVATARYNTLCSVRTLCIKKKSYSFLFVL